MVRARLAGRLAGVLRAVVVPAVLVVLTALPALVLGRIYADSLLVVLMAGAAVASIAVSVLARRLPSWTVAPLSVLLLAGYTLAALRMAADRADLAGPLRPLAVDALTNGIPRLLTAMIPVEATPDTVAVPVIAAWLAGLAGAEVALRAGRVLLGCLPAAALFAGALYVVGPNAGTAGWPAPVFAALVAVALAVSARPAGQAVPVDLPAEVPAGTRAAVRGRALAGAAAGLGLVLLLIALVGPWVGGRVGATPVDPRRYVQPPTVDTLDESPLNRISGWSLDPGQRLFEYSPGPAPAPSPAGTGGQRRTERVRLAVLPDYDGVTWRVGATYRNAGRVLPTAATLPGARLERVRREITVDGLTGRLLPAVPTPADVEGARVAYDPVTGTLIHPEGLRPGLRYAVTSQRELPDLNRLPFADVPTDDSTTRFLAVGSPVPEQIQRLAEQLATDNGAAYDRATAIEEFLAEHYLKVADAPSGHAYPNLAFFLFGPRNQGGQRGTSEQFAAAFAVLGRLTGLPTRVVVGFDAPAAGGTVTGADASAWPEVLFDGLGWVPFDPMPSEDSPPRPVEEDFTARPATPPPSAASPTSAEPPLSAPPTTVLAAPPPAGTAPGLVAGGVSAAVLLTAGAVALVLLALRRAQRRRRLAAGAPGQRVEGAWLEFTDALRLAGRPPPTHLAATEVAAYAATAPPLRRQAPDQPVHLPRVDELVAGVNTGAFAPRPVDQAQAERAGRQAVAYADALRAHRPWWRRVLWSVHPGPLRWHRGR